MSIVQLFSSNVDAVDAFIVVHKAILRSCKGFLSFEKGINRLLMFRVQWMSKIYKVDEGHKKPRAFFLQSHREYVPLIAFCGVLISTKYFFAADGG